jgi:hypothetical protein
MAARRNGDLGRRPSLTPEIVQASQHEVMNYNQQTHCLKKLKSETLK